MAEALIAIARDEWGVEREPVFGGVQLHRHSHLVAKGIMTEQISDTVPLIGAIRRAVSDPAARSLASRRFLSRFLGRQNAGFASERKSDTPASARAFWWEKRPGSRACDGVESKASLGQSR